MGLKKKVQGKLVRKAVKSVAAEYKTTILGGALMALLGANVDFSKVLEGDTQQIGAAVIALLVGALGWYMRDRKAADAESE